MHTPGIHSTLVEPLFSIVSLFGLVPGESVRTPLLYLTARDDPFMGETADTEAVIRGTGRSLLLHFTTFVEPQGTHMLSINQAMLECY